MAYNNNTMKLIDGMMPPTTTDKASFSTKTTASSQLGKTAEQIAAEESNYYSVLENLPEEIRKVAKTSMDNAAKSAEEERNRKFNNAMRTKGISAYEFSQLTKALGNNVNKAKDAVINYHVYRIRSIIADYNKKTPLPDNNSQTSTGSSAITNDNGNNNTSFADADDEVVAESLLVLNLRDRWEKAREFMKDVNIPDSAKEEAIKGIVDSGRSIDSYKSGYDVEPISEYERLVKARNAKGISLEEWGWLISANQGNEENAKNDLYTKSTSDIRKMIAADKDRDEDVRYGWQKAQGQGDIYAERTNEEWDEFTGGQIPLPDLTIFDSIEVKNNNRSISQSEVILDKAIPGAVIGSTLGLPFLGIGAGLAYGASILTGVGGSVVSTVLDPSLKSSGPSESFGVIARDEDNKITAIYEAVKYNHGGIDMVTTYRTDGVVDGVVTRDYYPYDSFKEE